MLEELSYLHLRLSNEEEELLQKLPEGKFFTKDVGGQKTAYVLAALEHKGRVERAGMGGYHDRYIMWRLRAPQGFNKSPVKPSQEVL